MRGSIPVLPNAPDLCAEVPLYLFNVAGIRLRGLARAHCFLRSTYRPDALFVLRVLVLALVWTQGPVHF
jgi:hypothetical protein